MLSAPPAWRLRLAGRTTACGDSPILPLPVGVVSVLLLDASPLASLLAQGRCSSIVSGCCGCGCGAAAPLFLEDIGAEFMRCMVGSLWAAGAMELKDLVMAGSSAEPFIALDGDCLLL